MVEQVEVTITQSLQQAEALRQSLLKKAFAGELLSPAERAAPDYQPAAELLAQATASGGARRVLPPQKSPSDRFH